MDAITVGWFAENSVYIFAALLSISELMAVTPALKGNGILHSIIEILRSLKEKKAV